MLLPVEVQILEEELLYSYDYAFFCAMYLNKGKILLALGINILSTIILGPNHSAKIALFITILSSINHTLDKVFFIFGIVSLIFIMLLPEVFHQNIVT